jgi:hypothetical protein
MENILEFKGPFNINDKDSYQNDLKKLNEPGIYIWGFMVDSNYNPINCKNTVSFSPEKMKFLPYYVGMATGKGKNNNKMTIYKRLNKHKKVSEVPASKYLRIAKEYLNSFFKDIPIHYDGDKKYCGRLMIYNIKNNNRAISYFNNPMFMFHSYQNKLKSKLIDLFDKNEPNNIPVTLEIFKDCLEIDPLNDIVNNKLNFWFCYADVESSKKSIDNKDITPFYESLESLTYFSLKGKTISKVKK